MQGLAGEQSVAEREGAAGSISMAETQGAEEPPRPRAKSGGGGGGGGGGGFLAKGGSWSGTEWQLLGLVQANGAAGPKQKRG